MKLKKKLKKYILLFALGVAMGEILTFLDLSFWLEISIYASVIAIIMIIFRNKL